MLEHPFRFYFIQNKDEPYVYKKVSESNIIFLILYIDDILLMGSNISLLDEVKEWLSRKFSMKDLREVSYILGMKAIEIDLKCYLDYPNPRTSIL